MTWKDKLIEQAAANPRIHATKLRRNGGTAAAEVVEEHYGIKPGPPADLPLEDPRPVDIADDFTVEF